MVTTLDASNLSLNDVRRLLKFEEHVSDSISSFLELEPLTEVEQQELQQIQSFLRSYRAAGKISEGQVKFLFLAPLMKLAGFYRPEIRITIEERIAEISVTDEDITIKGRMDILAVDQTKGANNTSLWILVLESKNSTIEVMEGLPQLLTYTYKSLEQQASVWGLITNGLRYQFVYTEQGNHPIYRLFPDLNLIYCDRAVELVQVLKAIDLL